MAEEQPGSQSTENPQKSFTIQKVYVKDLSFESPNTPEIFRRESDWHPKSEVQINWNAQQFDQDLFEVVLTLTVTAKDGDNTAYLVEVQQAGVFRISGFEKEELGPVLGSYCPNLLYPYASQSVSDLILKGGFPQVVLKPVNFDLLYAQQAAKQSQQAADTGEAH